MPTWDAGGKAHLRGLLSVEPAAGRGYEGGAKPGRGAGDTAARGHGRQALGLWSP